MENFREGKSQVDYLQHVETIITDRSATIDSLTIANDNEKLGSSPIYFRRKKIIEKLDTKVLGLLDELAGIEDATDQGMFFLPDGQFLESVSPLDMSILSHTPRSLRRAIPLADLTEVTYGNEIRSNTTREEEAQENVRMRVNSLNERLQTYGWEIRTPLSNNAEEEAQQERFFLTTPQDAAEQESARVLKKTEPKKTENDSSHGSIEDAVFFFPEPSQEVYRLHAIERLKAYLETPGDKVLRKHQIETFEKLLHFFEGGETAGTIVLPPGAGKTYILAELTRVLGVQTLIFSNTMDIMDKNKETIEKLNPTRKVTAFSGDKKDASGDIVSTLYQTFQAFQKEDLEKFGLVLYDESDLSLGEERLKIHARFPNALKIALTATPDYQEYLTAYEERGVISPKDEWLGTFTNIIHELKLEDALQDEVIPKLRIHLVETEANIPIKEIIRSKHSEKQIMRYLNTRGRNALVLGMIGGIEQIPEGITIPTRMLQEIQKIHSEIQGKRTLIHGLGIDHIKQLEAQLRNIGVSAKAIYGDMKENRKSIIDAVQKGDIQVLLGDELTGRGLDIPSLEASIHMDATYVSSRKLLQQVGRLFRHSPETGKTIGIAIQLVDKQLSALQPILIPSLFSPDFVRQGYARGKESHKSNEESNEKRDQPMISIEGDIDLNAYFETSKVQMLLQNRFKDASVKEMHDIVTDIFFSLSAEEFDKTTLYDLYSLLAEELPTRVNSEVNKRLLDTIQGDSERDAQMALQTLIIINLKSILPVVAQYQTDNEQENNDLTQEVLEKISQKGKSFNPNVEIPQQLHTLTHQSARQFRKETDMIPIGWQDKKIDVEITRVLTDAFLVHPYGLSMKVIDQIAKDLSSTFKISVDTIREYITVINSMKFHDDVRANLQDQPYEKTIENNFDMDGILQKLENKREYEVIKKRFFENKTLEEVAKELQVTRERIRQIEARALRRLRQPSFATKLRENRSTPIYINYEENSLDQELEE